MTTEWTITKAYQGTDAAEVFASLDDVFELEGEVVAADDESATFPYRVGSKRYYVKRYHKTKEFRSYLGMSRIVTEWRNQQKFLRWGLPAARVVAYGQERFLSKTRRGVLITEALENTCDLAQMADQDSPLLKDRAWVRGMLKRLAEVTRDLHSHRFAHNDLKWRNILVTQSRDDPEVYLIDCPAGRSWIWPFLEYRIIKDLACLDKVAKYQFSRTQRLAFYFHYSGHSRLSCKDKRRIRKVLGFFTGRE
ncbi:lipopolysaccharide kinase InaA family protein [Aestuariirhabdus sp. Z084]|uniref:lipopolysaccharide kinase InaA family protein n=1 Tax=Aestuariirhabdus haliotis TaxID=2918751 RepID=UPI00201B3D65|nr:lipopolysaccharide kinase InaA family protein [Aestuariirhabdus haliotis]MCL6415592.1 lipopolysaccharide kinase InaA family protein [Aestuariirhabdus haliotis]MCL6419587.1 lipopolysaccharide kinase InaA family protein [Aestuariirhabdus haliotis]